MFVRVCVTHACADPIDWVLQTALLAGSMCQWLIPLSPKGRPLPPAPPPVLLSPPHHHLHRWVLLFPHRMAIEGFQRGWFSPPLHQRHG